LLRGCALSLYFLETHPTAVSVVIGIASFAAIFYLYIVIVEVVFPIWLYQTPGEHDPNRPGHIPGRLCSVFSASVERSACRHLLSMVRDGLKENYRPETPHITREPSAFTIRLHIFLLPVCLLADASHLLIAITRPFTVFARRAYLQLWQGSEQRTTMLDLPCISWTLRTSPDVPILLSALNYLATMTPAHFDTTLVMSCFDTFIGCVKVTNGKVTIITGLEQLAAVSSLCCLHTLSYLTVTDTIVSVENVRHRYTRTFPSEANFDGLPFSHTLGAIHSVFYQTSKFRVGLPTRMDQMTLITWRAQLPWRDHWWEDGKPSNDERITVAEALSGWARKPWRVQWNDYRPSSDEHIIAAHALAKLAQFEYRRRGHRKVPRWLLLFAFRSLSQQPPPPTSVTIDCLSIIAFDLGCNSSNVTTPDKRFVHI